MTLSSSTAVWQKVHPHRPILKDADYCFGYDSEAGFAADKALPGPGGRLVWNLLLRAGEDYARTDPLYEGKFHTVVRCKHHGMVTDPGAYVKALADHFTEMGGSLIIAEVEDVAQAKDGLPEVVTSEGRLAGDKLAPTAGAWSRPPCWRG